MSSELQFDVRCLSCCGGDIWWTLTKERQAWCCLQVKLCDPCLSALSVPPWSKKRYINTRPFLFLSKYWRLSLHPGAAWMKTGWGTEQLHRPTSATASSCAQVLHQANCATLVGPPILTLVVTNIDLISPILTDCQTLSVTNRPLVINKGVLLQYFCLCHSRCEQSYCGIFSMATLYIFLSVN